MRDQFLSVAMLKSIPVEFHRSRTIDSHFVFVAIRARSRYHVDPLPQHYLEIVAAIKPVYRFREATEPAFENVRTFVMRKSYMRRNVPLTAT